MCSDTPLDKVPEDIADVDFGRGNLLVVIVVGTTVEMDADGGRGEGVDFLTDTYVFDQLS
jgi:hypothetical protein